MKSLDARQEPRLEDRSTDELESITEPDDNAALSRKTPRAMALEAMCTLLELLHFDLNETANDVTFYLQAGRSLDEGPKARAAAMVRNDHFKTFISEPDSSMLLVNGRADLSSVDGVSPLSFVAAELVKTTGEQGSAFIASFFCGRHRPAYGQTSPYSQACNLIASLLGQLIAQLIDRGVEIDLSFLKKDDWQDLHELKLTSLCFAFRRLAKQLPRKSLLLCVVDEIALYETEGLANDTEATMSRLAKLVRAQDDVIFKLLVTSHNRALYVWKYFIGHMLNLQEDIEPDDSSGWHVSAMGDVQNGLR